MTDADARSALAASAVYPEPGIESGDRTVLFVATDAAPWRVSSDWTGAQQ